MTRRRQKSNKMALVNVIGPMFICKGLSLSVATKTLFVIWKPAEKPLGRSTPRVGWLLLPWIPATSPIPIPRSLSKILLPCPQSCFPLGDSIYDFHMFVHKYGHGVFQPSAWTFHMEDFLAQIPASKFPNLPPIIIPFGITKRSATLKRLLEISFINWRSKAVTV